MRTPIPIVGGHCSVCGWKSDEAPVAQEPVAWLLTFPNGVREAIVSHPQYDLTGYGHCHIEPLYTSPAVRKA